MAEEPEDFREFVRSLMARSDRYFRESTRMLDAALERSDRRFEAAMRRVESEMAETTRILGRLTDRAEEQRAEHKAKIDALMRMLDRLPPPDTGPAAA